MLMTLRIITWRAGVAIDIVIRFCVCCAHVIKLAKLPLWFRVTCIHFSEYVICILVAVHFINNVLFLKYKLIFFKINF